MGAGRREGALGRLPGCGLSKGLRQGLGQAGAWHTREALTMENWLDLRGRGEMWGMSG